MLPVLVAVVEGVDTWVVTARRESGGGGSRWPEKRNRSKALRLSDMSGEFFPKE